MLILYPLRLIRRAVARVSPGLADSIPAEWWLLGYVASLLTGGLIALSCLSWVTESYFEAAAFNHATGKNVSTWDAMWIELRVLDRAKD